MASTRPDTRASDAGEPVRRPPAAVRRAGRATACTAASACRPARPTCCGARRWTRPRGRIYLMQARARGRAADRRDGRALRRLPGLHGLRHGVPVRRAVRPADRGHPRAGRAPAPPAAAPTGCCASAIFALFPHPRRLRLLRGPLRPTSAAACSGSCSAAGCWTGSRRRWPRWSRSRRRSRPAPPLPERVAARGERRAVVGMLTGCVQGEFFPRVNAATARVLAMEGCDVVIPRGQGCCGALQRAQRPRGGGDGLRPPHHRRVRGGRRRARRRQRRRLRLVDEGVRRAAAPTTRRTPSAPRRFAAKVRDVSELLAELGPVAARHPLPVTVAYHDACHLAHAQGVRAQPRAAAARHPRPRAARDRRPGDLLRLGRRLQPAQPARPPASSATARRGRCSPPAPTCW